MDSRPNDVSIFLGFSDTSWRRVDGVAAHGKNLQELDFLWGSSTLDAHPSGVALSRVAECSPSRIERVRDRTSGFTSRIPHVHESREASNDAQAIES